MRFDAKDVHTSGMLLSVTLYFGFFRPCFSLFNGEGEIRTWYLFQHWEVKYHQNKS